MHINVYIMHTYVHVKNVDVRSMAALIDYTVMKYCY